jgi:hypothetical protein
MSVLKYLSAGKSLIGLKQNTVRYQMGEPGALPRFDSKRNPFRSRTAQVASLTTKPVVAGAAESTMPKRSEIQAPTVTLVSSPVVVGPASPIAEPVVAVMPKATRVTAVKRVAKASVSILRRSIMKVGDIAGQGVHGINALALWRKNPGPAVPRLFKAAVQGELSLDAVKVVRNDLTDADFEVVPKNRKPTVGGGEWKGEVPTAAPIAASVLRTARLAKDANSPSPLVEAGREG